MKDLPPLGKLSDEEKNTLIKAQWQELQKLRAEIEKLKKKRVKKTARNSSLSPAKGFKPNQSKTESIQKVRQGSVGRSGGGRELSQSPEQVVVARAKSCPHCGASVFESSQKLQGIYDRIELPIVRPHVTRVERYGGVCECCGQAYAAPVPVGLEPGSPYGVSVASLLTYLRYSQSISYQRLHQLMSALYSLEISEGAIANVLKRVKKSMADPVHRIVERLRSSRLVGSDETGARVKGQNQWEWVFQNEQVCLHVIHPTRSKQVISEVMAGHRPQIWISDLFSSQKANPAEQWQVCLAHQLRDCQYAIDTGDDLFAPLMKRLLLRAIALSRRRHKMTSSTFIEQRNRCKRLLLALLALKPTNEEAQRLQRRYQHLQQELFLFLDDETVPPTNNRSEQALRPSVIFRKVTNGFRSDWGAELFAQVRSLIDTAKRQGFSAFDAIYRALTSHQADWLLS